jgi:hypothetical protein
MQARQDNNVGGGGCIWTERKRDERDSSCDKEMEKISILMNKTYLSRSKLERDEEERRTVVRDEKNNLSDKHKCEEAGG